MIVLGLQLIFATVASIRGWGFRPWAYLIILAVVSFMFGFNWPEAFLNISVLFLVADIGLAAYLGYMAFSPKRSV